MFVSFIKTIWQKNIVLLNAVLLLHHINVYDMLALNVVAIKKNKHELMFSKIIVYSSVTAP